MFKEGVTNKPKICLYCARHENKPFKLMPLGIGYIAAYLLQEKIVNEREVHIVDSLDEARMFKPNILAVSTVSQVLQNAKDFAKRCKEEFNCLTVLGGYHITGEPCKLPKEFDIGVMSEGEETFGEIVQISKVKELTTVALKQIKGICYQKDSQVVVNERRGLIKNIDLLPMPYRHKKYSDEIPIFTSRGCPYRCIFCASPKFWGGEFRMRSTGSVVSEIDFLVTKYRPKEIVILDDLWMADKQRFRKIVEELIKRKIPGRVRFRGFCRSDIIGEEEIGLLKDMNYRVVRFGAETGSEKLLKRLKGNSVSIVDHQRVIDLCQKHNVCCSASFMFGIPGETIADIKETIKFLRKNRKKCQIAGFYFFNPYPGTEIMDWMKGRKLIRDNFRYENLQLDFLEKSFSWDNIAYFNQENVPLQKFKKLVEKIRKEFIEKSSGRNTILNKLLRKILKRHLLRQA